MEAECVFSTLQVCVPQSDPNLFCRERENESDAHRAAGHLNPDHNARNALVSFGFHNKYIVSSSP